MRLIWGISVALVAATSVEAQDISQRPQARPVVEPAYADVRPVARPSSDSAVGTDDTSTELGDQVIATLAATPIPLIAHISTASAPVVEAPVVAETSAEAETLEVPVNPIVGVTSAARDAVTGPLAIVAAGGVTDPTLRPAVRPEAIAPLPPAQPTLAMRPEARRIERPELARGAQTQPIFRAEQNLFAFSPTAIANSLRPTLRPAAFVQRAEAARAAVRRGQVCGDPAIQGEAIGNVPGSGACGVENAVRVRSVAGVALTSRAVMNCRTASALKRWVVNGAQPAVANTGGGLATIRVIGSYSCRNRNAAATGRLSEHAFGNAIDIAGFVLNDGREISVLRGWNAQGDGARLRQMWRAACGPFGTVLGPNANRFHRDHFHFDTARYRSGSYCR